MLDAGREVGYWMLDEGHCECGARSRMLVLRVRSAKQDNGHCECGARSRIMVTASAEREVGYWMLDAGCWMQNAGHCECGARSRMLIIKGKKTLKFFDWSTMKNFI